MEISDFYQEVIKSLNNNNVEFLLMGGLAVGFHGYARYTGDMDLWINPSGKNLKKLSDALKSLKYSTEVINQIIKSRPIDHPTPIRLFSEDEKFKVDLMTTIFYEPLTFKACKERSVKNDLGGFTLHIIGIRDLIEIKSSIKRSDGSLKDLVDAQELRKILDRGESIDIEKKTSLLKRIFKKLGKGKGMSM